MNLLINPKRNSSSSSSSRKNKPKYIADDGIRFLVNDETIIALFATNTFNNQYTDNKPSSGFIMLSHLVSSSLYQLINIFTSIICPIELILLPILYSKFLLNKSYSCSYHFYYIYTQSSTKILTNKPKKNSWFLIYLLALKYK